MSQDNHIWCEKEYYNGGEWVEARKYPNYFTGPIFNIPYAELLNKVGNISGKKVLIYGCGDGHGIDEFLEHGAEEIIGIDISESMIDKAKKRFKNDNVKFIVMNAEDLEFPPETFDIVFGIAVLHHLFLEKAYKQLLKVLKPGGSAIFLEPLGHNIFVNLFRKLTPDARTPHEHPLLMSDLRQTQKFFEYVNHTEFFCWSLFMLGILPICNILNKNLFPNIFNWTYKLDMRLLKLFPFFRKYCWIVILELKKEKQTNA